MPKKSRREKILADARKIIRKAQIHNQNTGLNNPGIISDTGYTYKPTHNVSESNVRTEQNIEEFKTVRKDIIRTAMMGIGILVMEYVTYLRFTTR